MRPPNAVSAFCLGLASLWAGPSSDGAPRAVPERDAAHADSTRRADSASRIDTARRADSTPRTVSVPRTRHVLLVMTDGFRWQEVFRGADPALMNQKHGLRDNTRLVKEFGRETVDERRLALWPFLWGTIAHEGQLYGNQDDGSVAAVTNGFKFSYPGYSEAFSGHADPMVNSNQHGANENTTVFEWLNQKSGFRGHVAAFATWGAFTRIFNAARSGVPVYDGWQVGSAPGGAVHANFLGRLYAAVVRYGRNGGSDGITQEKALDYLVTRQPRLLFVGFGETDEDAHSGHYDQYLRSAHQVDSYLQQLWTAVQADPELKDRTTMIVTTDHGRGNGLTTWRDHGADVAGSENIWLGVIGPDIPALGMRSNIPAVQQSQIAATIAALLGQDFQSTSVEVAPPIADVLKVKQVH